MNLSDFPAYFLQHITRKYRDSTIGSWPTSSRTPAFILDLYLGNAIPCLMYVVDLLYTYKPSVTYIANDSWPVNVAS